MSAPLKLKAASVGDKGGSSGSGGGISLLALPQALLAEILLAVCADASSATQLARLALVCTATRDIVMDDAIWVAYVRTHWGPLHWASYFRALPDQAQNAVESGRETEQKHEQEHEEEAGPCHEQAGSRGHQQAPRTAWPWKALVVSLEAELRPLLRRSVGQAVGWLRERGLLGGTPSEHAWLAHLLHSKHNFQGGGGGGTRPVSADRALLISYGVSARDTLQLHRRVAAYACVSSEGQPIAHMRAFLRNFRLAPTDAELVRVAGHPQGGDATSPLAVLRRLLLQFPFLPIDAGGGADRIIGALAWCCVRDLPAGTHTGTAARWLGHQQGVHREEDTIEAVHLVIYSGIMLNTDLHNPAVNPKMTLNEFVSSLYRAPLLRTVPRARIEGMFESVQRDELKIHSFARVDTFVRASTDGDDEVRAAQYSRYSYHGTRERCLRLTAVWRTLATARGRATMKFEFKRWRGRHYHVVRPLEVLGALALGCLLLRAACWGWRAVPLPVGLLEPQRLSRQPSIREIAARLPSVTLALTSTWVGWLGLGAHVLLGCLAWSYYGLNTE